MLSKQAFNGLLKTLEEPPKKLKFILATTEARKIPVTVLSRCQRFDLRRVGLDKIFSHLKQVSNIEKGKISDEALKLLARASEGSVRDSVSLLDRALIFQALKPGQIIEDTDIRKMLGLADKSKLIELLKEIFEGNSNKALKILRELIEEGLDAKNFLNDILELIYLFSRRINLGKIEKDLFVSDSELELIEQVAKDLKIQDLGLFWQLTLKTIEDLNISSNEIITLEMYIIQITHIKSIEGNQEEINLSNNEIKQNQTGGSNVAESRTNFKTSRTTKDQLKNIEQIRNITKSEPVNEIKFAQDIKINSFEELIKMADEKKEMELKYDLERNVKLLKFKDGKIDINFNQNLNKNFIKKLSQCLYEWTGKRWIISLSKVENLKTFYQKKIDQKNETLNKEKESATFKEILKTFPDAHLIDVGKEDE
tara:strand:- start:887 stop:2161 length:1275 start_codon:yes stop_codon:yes gene_type:complete